MAIRDQLELMQLFPGSHPMLGLHMVEQTQPMAILIKAARAIARKHPFHLAGRRKKHDFLAFDLFNLGQDFARGRQLELMEMVPGRKAMRGAHVSQERCPIHALGSKRTIRALTWKRRVIDHVIEHQRFFLLYVVHGMSTIPRIDAMLLSLMITQRARTQESAIAMRANTRRFRVHPIPMGTCLFLEQAYKRAVGHGAWIRMVELRMFAALDQLVELLAAFAAGIDDRARERGRIRRFLVFAVVVTVLGPEFGLVERRNPSLLVRAHLLGVSVEIIGLQEICAGIVRVVNVLVQRIIDGQEIEEVRVHARISNRARRYESGKEKRKENFSPCEIS